MINLVTKLIDDPAKYINNPFVSLQRRSHKLVAYAPAFLKDSIFETS